jgi:hypothetical protein
MDGDLDIVLGKQVWLYSFMGAPLYFENTGSSTSPAFSNNENFAFHAAEALGLADIGPRSYPMFADIDADGDADLFLHSWGSGMNFFENTLIDDTTCNPPSALSIVNVRETKVKLTWNNVPNADRYKIYYKPVGTPPPWMKKNSFDNIRILNGLQPGTTYKYRIKSRCPGLGWSGFSQDAFFTTLPLRLGADLNQIRIYPNPANEVVNIAIAVVGVLTNDNILHSINNDIANIKIEMFNLLGQTVYSWQGKSDGQLTHSIDVSGLAAGQYVVKIKAGELVENKKVIIF